MLHRKLLVAIAGLTVASVAAVSVALAAPAEPGSGFSKHTAIEADFGSTFASNLLAPRSIKQGCGADRNNHAVWFKFTPPISATVEATTEGSSIDTVLAVYQNGKRLDCDDDSGSGFASSLTFEATAGTTYYFTVTSFDDSAGGLIQLNLGIL